MFAAELKKIEAAVKADWEVLSGDARRDAEQALAALKAELAKLEPAAQALKTELEQAVEVAVPSVTQAVEAALAKFLAEVVPEMATASGPEGDQM